MSGDPRNYYTSSRHEELPPLREVVGDALGRPPVSPYRAHLHDVSRASPGSSSSHRHYQSPGGYYLHRGPTLAPIRNLPPSRSLSSRSSSHRGRSDSAETPHRDPRRGPPEASAGHACPAVASPQPATGPLPYSYNVLRAQQGDLVDVRTPSSRAQGILRPTALIDDEDDSHKRYRCTWPGCEKKYDRPSSLEVHRNTHTGSQPYPCPHPGCPRAFNVKSNMLRHFRSHPKPKASQSSVAHVEQESDSEGDDDKNEWPAESGGRFFHSGSSSPKKPSSSSSSIRYSEVKKSDESAVPPSSNQYYSSSRRC